MKFGSFPWTGLWIGMTCVGWGACVRLNAQPNPVEGSRHGSVLATNVFRGWLSSVSRSVVVDLQQEGLTPDCRDESGGLLEALLDELLDAHLSVFFSPHFIQTELEYYRAHHAVETNQPVADGVVAVLERAQARGEIDWARLRELHSLAPDADVITRHLPWLGVAPARPQKRVASADEVAGALLIVKLRWSGIPMQGVVANPKHRRGTSGRFSGQSTLWKIDGEVCLEQSGAPRIRLTYPAPAWKATYESVESRPLYLTRQALLHDIKTGAASLPESAGDPKPKRKPKENEHRND